MAQPYVGEIRMFAGNFNPLGWQFCDGRLLPISENDTLFQLIGTTYGGDGQSTFALPDLRGRLPLHKGNNFIISETGGGESVTLTVQQIPLHTHPMLGTSKAGGVSSPVNAFLGKSTSNTPYTSDISTGLIALRNSAVAPVGGSQPHTNFQPYLCINYIISLFGLFPSQT